jgi:hypothetical protein
MKTKIIALLATIALNASSAAAVNNASGIGASPIIVFRNHAARTLEIEYAPASSFTDPTDDDVFDFVPVNNDSNAANYLNTNGVLSYSVPVPPTPPPTCNVNAWETAVWADQNIPMGTKMQGIVFYPLIEKNALSNPTDIMEAWGALMGAANASPSQAAWLTSGAQTLYMHYAALYLVPLTSQTAAGIDPATGVQAVDAPTSESLNRSKTIRKSKMEKTNWQLDNQLIKPKENES